MINTDSAQAATETKCLTIEDTIKRSLTWSSDESDGTSRS